MTREKQKKIIVAGTIAAVLLLVFLLGVIIYQLVSISVAKKRIAEYNTQIETYQEVIEKAEQDLEYYKSQYYLDFAAREYGYIYPEDKK